MKLNFRLKQRIMEKFRTQYDFADHVQMHYSAVSMVLNNRRKLSGEKKELWAKTLGCSVEDIFGEKNC